MARIPFQDTFDTLDMTGNWSGGSYNTSTFTAGGTLHMYCPSGQTYYRGLVSTGGTSLAGNQVTIQIVNAGNQTLAGFEFYPLQVYANTDASANAIWLISGNNLMVYTKGAGTMTWRWATTFDINAHKYLRLRESGGTTYWGYSADGSTWTEPFSIANFFNVTNVQLEITVGTWEAEASDSTAIVDNLNILPGDAPITPPAPVTVTADRVPFSDPFDSIVYTGRYDDSYNTNSLSANGTLNLTTYASDTTYHGLATGTPFDLTAKETTIQIVDAGNQALTSFELYPMQLYPVGDTTHNLVWFISGGSLAVYVTIGSNRARKWSTTFDITKHTYLRIRESGGTAYFGYSSDGAAWQEVYNTALSWPVTNMTLEMTVGTWQAEASASTAKLDNLNILPGDSTAIYTGFFNFF